MSTPRPEQHRCKVCGRVGEGSGNWKAGTWICRKCSNAVSDFLKALTDILDERYQQHEEVD